MIKSAQRYLKWLFCLTLVSLPVGAWAWWTRASSPPQAVGGPAVPEAVSGQLGPTTQFQITQGTSAIQIGEDLQRAGLIRSTTAWKLWARWLMTQNSQGGFQAGIYRLSPTQPLPAIAHQIWTGDVVQTSLTVPEGWSMRQMAKYFEAQGFFSAEDFLKAATAVPDSDYPWLPQNLPHLEGFLYPDTYQFPKEQITPEAVVQAMLDRFEQVALPLYQERRSQTQLSLKDWVTLASIVEKEAVVAAERPRIAGVFFQRLTKNIPLGADPTVEYALRIQQTPDQPLTLAQVKTPSAYNTYLKTGLPPTPIASPGLASLKAALAPEPTPYLYFVARYDGTHFFSRTLAEHEAAQARIHAERLTQQSAPQSSN